ncbi:MAG: 23S rRNA (uracil(1939)-C(5))-methyltransferase RlmD [Clostridia bacterium]|nr:23S rRNA (uracil(1939)-C(5))-methyltransferase RlmD [Clostridia bacterium]
MKPGDRAELRITDMNGEGCGIGRHGGIVVFVRDTVTGDTCLAEITEVRKNYALAECVSLIEASPYRREPDCPVYTECGGCTLSHVTAETELELKKNMVQQALRREGLTDIRVEDVLYSSRTGYRNKVIYHFDKTGTLGYYSQKSRRIQPESIRCLLNPPICTEILQATEKYIRNTPAFPTLPLRSLYIRTNHTGEAAVSVITESSCGKREKAVLAEYAAYLNETCPGKITGVLHGKENKGKYAVPAYTVIWRDRYVYDTFGELQLRISPEGFYQVNHDGAALLAETVLDFAGETRITHAADLYCGSGFFGLLLAKKYPEISVTGIEINPDSIRDAEYNRKTNRLDNMAFFCGNAADYRKNTANLPEFVIVDPPRAGMSERMREELCELCAERIAYVSCNPITLARDLRMLIERGYCAAKVTPVDMFPGTGHIESVVCLYREKID